MSQNLVSQNNIKINPVNVFWQIEAQEQWDLRAVVAATLNNQYILMQLQDGTKHYFWFNYNATGADPTPAGAGTGHVVTVAIGASASTIATSLATAIDGIAGLAAAAVGAVVTSTRDAVGQCVDSDAATAVAIVCTVVRRGKDFNLGLLKGDIDPKFSPANLVINAHQYGKTPLASLNQGFDKIECDTTLLETDTAKLNILYSIYGGTVVGGTSSVLGAGTSVLGTNILREAARLVFKPVNAEDNLQNFNLTLALPVPGSLKFSGENPSELTVTWMGFVDLQLNPKINAVAIGDLSQTGLEA